jgi:hypothetical protein
MRTYVPRLVVLGAFVLVTIAGAVAFLAAGGIARHFDPAADESHLSAFMVAIIGVAVAVGSAFPIFARGVPWATARLLGARDGAVLEPAQEPHQRPEHHEVHQRGEDDGRGVVSHALRLPRLE